MIIRHQTLLKIALINLSCLFIFRLINTPITCAQGSLENYNILISEIYPAPISGETEWIELYNPNADPINLTGWYMMDQLSSPSLIYQFTPETSINSHQAVIFTLKSSKLNNNGDGVSLFNAKDELVDQVSYPQAQSSLSYSLLDIEAHQYGWTKATPGEFNATPSPTATPEVTPTNKPTVTPSATVTPTTTNTPTPRISPTPSLLQTGYLKLTEVLACPKKNQSEWLEVYTLIDQPIKTTLLIKDEANNHFQFELNLVPSQHQVIYLPHSILNNDGDTLYLFNTANQLLTQLTLPKCQVGKSYSLVDNIWQLVDQPTPGEENVKLTLTTPSPTATLTPTEPIKPTITFTPTPFASAKQITPNNLAFKKLTQSKQSLLNPHLLSLPNLTASTTGQVLGATTINHVTATPDQASNITKPWYLLSVIIGNLHLIIGGVMIKIKNH